MQKKVPYVAQLGNMDCSIACMTMLFRYYGLDVDIVDVGQVVHIGRDGVNLTQLKQAMTKMLKKLFDIDPSFFEWHAVGEIVNRFSNVQAINNIIINTFSQVAVQIITSTICLVTMFVYSPSLSVITIAIGTIELVLLLGINKKNREDTSKYIADQSNMQGLLAEAIGNIIEIRCMGMEKAIYKNLTNQFLDELESFRKKSNTGNQMLAISSTITLIFPLIIYILGYSSVVNEALTIGQLIAYVTLANYFISPFVSIVIALPNLNFVYEVFLRYKELITYRETHKNGVIGGQQFEELYLANVSFSYNHSLNQKVLNDISLHIRPQELCAIVGFSGSGKSTLLKIILGLLSPDVGTVKINSIKANDFSHDRMYEWFSVVTQNPMCLNSSVRKNVDVTESFSDDDIWNALKVSMRCNYSKTKTNSKETLQKNNMIIFVILFYRIPTILRSCFLYTHAYKEQFLNA